MSRTGPFSRADSVSDISVRLLHVKIPNITSAVIPVSIIKGSVLGGGIISKCYLQEEAIITAGNTLRKTDKNTEYRAVTFCYNLRNQIRTFH